MKARSDLEKFVTLTKFGKQYYVYFKVGNQSFNINPTDPGMTKTEAEWTRDMFCKALENIIQSLVIT